MKTIKITFSLALIGFWITVLSNIIFGEGDYAAFWFFLGFSAFFAYLTVSALSDMGRFMVGALGIISVVFVVVALCKLPDAPIVTAERFGREYKISNHDHHCSPLAVEPSFVCFGPNPKVTRGTCCAECGRRYMDHYPKIYSSDEWRSEVRRRNYRKEVSDVSR